MSILIKNMEMPTKCSECQFCVNGFTEEAPVYECAVLGAENVSVPVDYHGKPFDFRPDWCPLIELPPHGRLIDADKLIAGLEECRKAADDNWEYEMVVGYSNAIEEVEEAHTVVEAEGEG